MLRTCRIVPAALAASLALASPLTADQDPSAGVARESASVEVLLSATHTVVGEPIAYPASAPGRLTAAVVVLGPREYTGWHTHGVPLVGYILEGELTVDYGDHGTRLYRQGEALAEAMEVVHNGHNPGPGTVRILVVFAGAKGVANSVPVAK
jgi:quercetin dioxygenase-like cupin family protein